MSATPPRLRPANAAGGLWTQSRRFSQNLVVQDFLPDRARVVGARCREQFGAKNNLHKCGALRTFGQPMNGPVRHANSECRLPHEVLFELLPVIPGERSRHPVTAGEGPYPLDAV